MFWFNTTNVKLFYIRFLAYPTSDIPKPEVARPVLIVHLEQFTHCSSKIDLTKVNWDFIAGTLIFR